MLILLMSAQALVADTISIFDEDFFESKERTDAWRDSSYECMTISAKSPKMESTKIKNVVMSKCSGTPDTVKWVPKSSVTKSKNPSSETEGYFVVCCTRETPRPRRYIKQ